MNADLDIITTYRTKKGNVGEQFRSKLEGFLVHDPITVWRCVMTHEGHAISSHTAGFVPNSDLDDSLGMHRVGGRPIMLQTVPLWLIFADYSASSSTGPTKLTNT